MAIPRIFISSTYYDLRYVREDLERFIRGLGYEPIRYETGGVPYTREIPLEESAYREAALCDMVVCIIGGRFGASSSSRTGSITQNELKEALEKGVQVYIFVEANVLSEYETYLLNKSNKSVKYKFVDNAEIFAFIESMNMLPINNPITPFSISKDICDFLQAQWAGLFQHFLQEQKRMAEVKVLGEMKSVASTLQQLVKYLTEERKGKDEAIKSILLANHPAFRTLTELLDVPYRVFFTNKSELNAWLRARGFKPINELTYQGSVQEWTNLKQDKYLCLSHEIFDGEGKLKPFSESEWSAEWLDIIEVILPEPEPSDLEAPF